METRKRPDLRLITFVQRVTWFLGQPFRLFFDIRAHIPHQQLRDYRRQGGRRPLILAASHELDFDPWLVQIASGFRTWSALAPVRALGTQDWTGLYRRLRRLIFVLYWLFGVVRLPPRSRALTREGKLRPVLDALRQGDVVGIFPEGHVRRPGEPSIRPFRVGVVILHRETGAPIVPLAIRVEPKRWRKRFLLWAGEPVMIPEVLDLEESAEWLRERIRELYERTKELR